MSKDYFLGILLDSPLRRDFTLEELEKDAEHLAARYGEKKQKENDD
jgi:hypothetical protein